MHFFLAKIIYRIICGDGKHTPQFDIQTRMIYAPTQMDAFSKATEIGNTEAYSFLNEKQMLVQWKFINVSEIICLTEYADGREIVSVIKEAYNAEDFIKEVHHKAHAITAGAISNFASGNYN
jgi:hypothetical protein